MSKIYHQRGADRRRFHIIYKTTCLVTGRYYIGMHSTDNLDDGYLGSGKRLWYSLNKHGRKNHICKIIEHLPSRESLRTREAEIVTEELIKHPMCMNLALGGGNGDARWGWGQTTAEREAERIQKLADAWNRPGYRENFKAKTSGRKRSNETRQKQRDRWTPERRKKTGNELAARTRERFKDYWLTHERPEEKLARERLESGYAPPDRAKQAIDGWAAIYQDETKLAAMKESMSVAKKGKIWMHKERTVQLLEPHEESVFLACGWKRGTGNRQKPKAVSAETRAKLAAKAKEQHARRGLQNV